MLTTCTACGCTCDDIQLSTDGDGAVKESTNACELGAAWLAESAVDGPVAIIDGNAVAVDEAITRAAEILSQAQQPLVAGFQHATTEAVRAAVALADQIGACIDWTTSEADAASTIALQTVGGVTGTLGELAQRADVVLTWGADLAATHPRHFERYSLEPASPWIRGRTDRKLIVVDDHASDTIGHADESIVIKPSSNFEAVQVLRSIVAGLELDAKQVEQQTGVALDVWRSLASSMSAAKFGAVVYGGSLAGSSESIAALTELMADLTATTRWISVPAGGPGNKTGAASALTWQTGYPLGVNLARNYPEYGPGEWTTRELLLRGEVDAALVVADDLATQLPAPAAAHLKAIPTVVLDWRATATANSAHVAIHTARPGVECTGTTYRVDGACLPMRACRQTERPPTEAVLGGIMAQTKMLSAEISS